MKTISTRFVFLLTILFWEITVAQPTVYESNPERSMYVNQFVKLMPNGDLYEDGSILGVDKNSDGVFEKERQLLEYAKTNHITHLIFYDLRNVFNRSQPLVWNQNDIRYETLEEHLCRFMKDAQTNYCISTFGADGGFGTLSNAAEFDGDPSTDTPTPSMVLPQILRNADPGLLIVEDSTLIPGSPRFYEAEFIKLFLRIRNFNQVNSCGVHFNSLAYDEEFWNSMTSFNSICTSTVIVTVDDQCNPCCDIAPCADDPNFGTDIQTPCSIPYRTNNDAEFFTHVLPNLEMLNVLQSNSQYPLKIELYLGTLYVPAISRSAWDIDMLDSYYYRDYNNPLVDRVLLVNYVTNPAYTNWTMYDEFNANSHNVTVPNQPVGEKGVPHTDIHPLLSTESILHGGYDDYIGPYLDADPTHTVFSFEKQVYEGWRTHITGANFSSAQQNNVQPGGFGYYASNMMVPFYDNPPSFYSSDFPACGLSGNYIVDWSAFKYLGPMEKGIKYTFQILDGANVIYNVTGISTDYSGYTTGYFSNIDFQNTSIFVPCTLALGNYIGKLELEYEFPMGCHYEYSCPLDVVNGPTIGALSNESPLEFCEGDYVWLQAIGGSGTHYSWEFSSDNINFGEMNPQVTSRLLKAEKDGYYRCFISFSSCVSDGYSDTIHITVNPNPPIQIVSDCVTNGGVQQVHLSLTTPGISSQANGNMVYHWSTGETTPDITVDYGVGTIYVYVYNINSSGCQQYGKIIIPRAFDPDHYFHFTVLSKSYLQSDNNPCTEDSIITVQLWEHKLDDHGIVIDAPVSGQVAYLWSDGTFGNSLSYPYMGSTYTLSATNGLTTQCYNPPYSYTAPSINPLSVTSTVTNVNCSNSNSGSITLIPSGSGNYQFIWPQGISNSQISTLNGQSTASGLLPGQYPVMVYDLGSGTACGGSYSNTITISAPANSLQLTNFVTNDPTGNCQSSSNGSITVNTSGGTPPLSYSWSNTLTTQTISSLPGGTYTVTITDANQCTITGMAHLSAPSSLVVTTNVVSPISCYSGTNGSIEAIVQSGTSPYTYSWNGVPAWNTSLISGLTSNIYTVTVTDANSCTATSVLTLGQPSELIASSTATPILCYGGNSNLTVSAIGGIQPYVGTGTSVVTAGSYSSTVTDNNGCTSSTSINIVEPQPLTLTVSQSSPLPCYGSNTAVAEAHVLGGTTPYIYAWSPSGGTGSNATGLSPGVYTVTVSDANQCGPYTESITIEEDQSCCDLNGLSDLHQSNFNTSHAISLTSYDLNESVSISAGVGIVITDCDISVGTGYTITIKQGGSLTLNGVTHLHGCSGMWGGIVVEPGGEFYIDGSPSAKPIIEDAEHGVYVEMVSSASSFHSGLKLRNGVFSSNYTDIFLEENSAGDINHVNIDVFGCLFNKTHDLFYSPNITQLGSSPFTAIKLNNFNGLIGSNLEQTNEFLDHNVGIQCFNSNVTVENCLFENIQPEAIYGNYYDGFAIHIKATNNLYTFHETGLGSASASPTFSNCKKGIYVEGSGGYIQSNRMSDVASGITLMQLLPYVKFEISSNYLICQKEGIVCYYNKSAEIIKIEDNLIEMDNPQNNSGIGIGLYEYYKSAPYIVADNILNLYHARGGIEVYGANRTNVHHNLISLYDDTKNLFGIALWSADENDISCNDVYGNSSDVANSTQIGFKVSMSKGNTIQCNNSSTTNTGFEFNNQCPNTKFMGNAAVYDQWIGLRVLNSGVMGVQKHYGNLWAGNFFSSGNTEVENTNTGNELASEFDVNSNAGPYYLPLHPVPASGWFNDDPNNQELECTASVVCGSANQMHTDVIDSSFDHKIAVDNYHVNDFDGENGWMAKKYLFEKIRQNPLLLNDPILFSFFEDELNSIIPEFDEVKSKILQDASILSANAGQLFGNHNNLDSLQKELEFADSLNQLFNGSNQAILATVQAIRMQISAIIYESKQLVEDVKQSENEKSDSIQTINSGINSSEVIQANEKMINEIYLNTLAKREHLYTSDQIQNLLSIAHQCPYAGGKSVFLARAMYNHINPEEEYFDNDLCTSLGYFRKISPEKRTYSTIITYPNPGNESITIESFNEAGFNKLEIYSLDMYLIRSVETNKKVKKYMLNTETLAPGLYIYKCSSSNETLDFGKISIVH